MRPFTDITHLGTKEFIADDNRGAVSTLPSLKMDGTNFFLSVKGIGSTTNPFSASASWKSANMQLVERFHTEEQNCEFRGNHSTIHYRGIMAKRLPIWGTRA